MISALRLFAEDLDADPGSIESRLTSLHEEGCLQMMCTVLYGGASAEMMVFLSYM